MVQLYLNNQECDLYGSETIATDYSIAPIANIASRTSAKSIGFKIPMTANNRDIIENAQVLVNSTTLPYSLIPAKLTVNGLSQKIEFAQIKTIKEDIEVTLFGSNVDFYSIIKGRKLEDLGDVFDHDWTLANAAASAANTEGYIYALIDFLNTPDSAFINNTDEEIDVKGLLPSVYLHSLITEVITQAGFTAQGNFLVNDNYQSIIIPATDVKIGRYKEQLNAHAEQSADNPSSPLFIFNDEINDPLNLIQQETFATSIGTFAIYRYRAYITGQYDIKLNLAWVNKSGSVSYVIERERSGAWVSLGGDSITGFPVNGNLVINLTDVELQDGDRVYAYFFGAGSITTGAGSYMHITDNDVTQTVYGKKFDVTTNLGNMKQSDLLKDTVQKFGLILQVDNINKIVHVRQFSEILDNIDIALDWSDKVDYSEKPEINFDSDYAQRNLCTYAEDDTVIKPDGTDSEIIIDNDHLEPEKELFESPFSASEQVIRFGDGSSIAQIKVITDINTADENYEDVEPRYLVRRFASYSPGFTYKRDVSTVTAPIVPLTHFILFGETFNAGWEDNLLDNSAELIAMIQQFKAANFLLRLNAADINQLDFFIPVWVELIGQPGCYFYVSEVKQFKQTANESTEVSLGKLVT